MRPWAYEAFKKRLPKRSCLRPESARSMLHAERFASALKRNLNVFLTINFNTLPRDPESNYYDIFRPKIWANIRRRWNAHCKRQGIQRPFAAIAVFENPPNRREGPRHYGPKHVHALLEWPADQIERLLYFLRRALAKHFARFRPNQVHASEVATGRTRRTTSYMAKGIDPPFAAHFYLNHAPQGHVAHRRIIISRCLGHAARALFRKRGGDPLPNRRTSWASY